MIENLALKDFYSWLGPSNERMEWAIDRLISMSKGRETSRAAYKFYYSFTTRNRYSIGRSDLHTTEQVRNELQEAYWVEEEDIRQFCYTWLCSFRNKLGHHFKTRTGVKYLTYALRDWLVGPMKVFSYKGWEEKYINYLGNQDYEMPQPPLDIQIILGTSPYYKYLKELSLYNKYLIYCYSLGYSAYTIGKINSCYHKQCKRDRSRLRDELEL